MTCDLSAHRTLIAGDVLPPGSCQRCSHETGQVRLCWIAYGSWRQWAALCEGCRERARAGLRGVEVRT